MRNDMDKLDNFCKNLNTYNTIAQKICSRDNLALNKISILNTDFSYSDVLEKITTLDLQLSELKKNNIIGYLLLAVDFDNNVYCPNGQNNNIDSFFLKKQYNDLINTSSASNTPNNSNIPFPKHPTIPWENVFTQDNPAYTSSLENEFPFNDIKNVGGQIYKKFQSLLYIIFWFEDKLSFILSKNEKFLNNINQILLNNKEANEKLGSINSSQLDSFMQFLKDNDKINETVTIVNKIQKNGDSLIEEITSKNTEISDLLSNVKTAKNDVDSLLKINKELSEKLSSNALSGTFEKAAESYTWAKRGKLFLITLFSGGLFYFVYDMLISFNIDKMILLEKTPLILLIYSTPRLFVFIVSAWILKFLISNYNNDSKIALDFKHRQAIADVTPHFKKELDDKEKQENLVVNAFNVFLSKPQFENIDNEKDNKLFFENISNLLTDSEIKNTLIKLRDLMIDRLKKNKSEEKEDKK
jgi:hypothetical protein